MRNDSASRLRRECKILKEWVEATSEDHEDMHGVLRQVDKILARLEDHEAAQQAKGKSTRHTALKRSLESIVQPLCEKVASVKNVAESIKNQVDGIENDVNEVKEELKASKQMIEKMYDAFCGQSSVQRPGQGGQEREHELLNQESMCQARLKSKKLEIRQFYRDHSQEATERQRERRELRNMVPGDPLRLRDKEKQQETRELKKMVAEDPIRLRDKENKMKAMILLLKLATEKKKAEVNITRSSAGESRKRFFRRLHDSDKAADNVVDAKKKQKMAAETAPFYREAVSLTVVGADDLQEFGYPAVAEEVAHLRSILCRRGFQDDRRLVAVVREQYEDLGEAEVACGVYMEQVVKVNGRPCFKKLAQTSGSEKVTSSELYIYWSKLQAKWKMGALNDRKAPYAYLASDLDTPVLALELWQVVAGGMPASM